MDDIVLLQKLLHDFVSTSKYLQQAASRWDRTLKTHTLFSVDSVHILCVVTKFILRRKWQLLAFCPTDNSGGVQLQRCQRMRSIWIWNETLIFCLEKIDKQLSMSIAQQQNIRDNLKFVI